MTQRTLRVGSLVLYKNRPARVKWIGTRLEIELERGDSLRVRVKDITLLHPGPLESLDELKPQAGEVQTAWEILAGDGISLADLSELIYGEYTPATAWAAWELVADGLMFQGTPDHVTARSAEDVERERAARAAKIAERKAWAAFLERVQAGKIIAEDSQYLREVEDLALDRQDKSRVLRELGRGERPENAHAILLELEFWTSFVNPYPQRLRLTISPPQVDLPDLPDEQRLDLTHLPAFAIDDEGNQDPDDALSLDGERLWVHVADVAALVCPHSAADLEARARGATLYLPEGAVPMLPPQAAQLLGLGLNVISPALSFGLDLGPEGQVENVDIVPTWVRVTRLTYAEADARLEDEPFKTLHRLAQRYAARRLAHGAIAMDLPEVKIDVVDREVIIRPLSPLHSRSLVTEAMLMAGEATARFALAHNIPFPFSTQEPPFGAVNRRPVTLSEMYGLRRALQRSQMTSVPTPHAGLGLSVYAQVTSPLRRYLDLVAHQQLRAHLREEILLTVPEMLERIGAAEAISDSVRRTERLSRQHWTAVYLSQRPDWQGEGILVDKYGSRGTVLIPELDLDPRVHMRDDFPLDGIVPLELRGVNLPELELHFRVRR